MKVVDLTQELFENMPVYPGDPAVSIKQVHTLEKEGWRLTQLTMSSHAGTHVNVPSHMVVDGKTLDGFSPDRFFGKCTLYVEGMKFTSDVGVIFASQNIDEKIAKAIIASSLKFIGLSAKFEFDIALEKLLLEHNIISFENLVNTDKLTPPHLISTDFLCELEIVTDRPFARLQL